MDASDIFLMAMDAPAPVVAIVALVSAGVGICWALRRVGGRGTPLGLPGRHIDNGPWRATLAAGSVGADLLTRARVAVHGLLALNQSEAIYLHAEKDSAGQALLAGESYEVIGQPLEARWWSLTLYGGGYLIANARKRYSYHSGNLAYESDASFRIRLAAVEQPGNWLPAHGTVPLSLFLRLYAPSPRLRERLDRASLPSIVRRKRSA